jgi:hypothetical protein
VGNTSRVVGVGAMGGAGGVMGAMWGTAEVSETCDEGAVQVLAV